MGWKSLWGILLACQIVVVTIIVIRHFRQEPIKPKVPDEWVVDTGCQDSIVRLDPIVEEEADAADDDNWRFVSDEEEAEPEAPVRQSVGPPPGTPPVASSPVLPDLGQPASSHGPDYNPNPRTVVETSPENFVMPAITEPPPLRGGYRHQWQTREQRTKVPTSEMAECARTHP